MRALLLLLAAATLASGCATTGSGAAVPCAARAAWTTTLDRGDDPYPTLPFRHVANDQARIFVESFDSSAANNTTFIAAINRTDGHTEWERQLPQTQPGSGFPSTPLVSTNGALVLGTSSLGISGTPGPTYAFDPATGADLWRRPANFETPIAAGDKLLIQGLTNMSRIDPRSGTTQWTYAHANEVSAAPDAVLVVNGTGAVTSLDIETGAPRWTTQLNDTAPPGFVELGAGHPQVLTHSGFIALDPYTGAPTWRRPDAPGISSGTQVGSRYYWAKPDGALDALDLATGNRIWTTQAGPTTFYQGSRTETRSPSFQATNDRVVLLASNGTTHPPAMFDYTTVSRAWLVDAQDGHVLWSAGAGGATDIVRAGGDAVVLSGLTDVLALRAQDGHVALDCTPSGGGHGGSSWNAFAVDDEVYVQTPTQLIRLNV